MAQRRGMQLPDQRAPLGQPRAALGAAGQMRFNCKRGGELQLIIDIGIQQRAHFIVGHDEARCSPRTMSAS